VAVIFDDSNHEVRSSRRIKFAKAYWEKICAEAFFY